MNIKASARASGLRAVPSLTKSGRDFPSVYAADKSWKRAIERPSLGSRCKDFKPTFIEFGNLLPSLI